MARETLSDEQVELEIQRLQGSEDVKLANRYERVMKRRRKYLYWLRQAEKRGKALREAGITMEMLRDEEYLAEMLEGGEEDE